MNDVDELESGQLSPEAARLREHLDLVGEAVAAEALGLTPSTLELWRRQEKAPDFIRIGRSVYYRRKDLMAWIAARVEVQLQRNAR